MHRAVAWLLVGTLAATSGVAVALHVHAYHEHDHPEHHHGPAVHAHEDGHERAGHHHRRIHPRPDDRRPRLAPCDPAAHAVSIAVAYAPAPQVHAADAAIAPQSPPVPPRRPGAVVRHADVRVHGPPPSPHASPRAPPLITPA